MGFTVKPWNFREIVISDYNNCTGKQKHHSNHKTEYIECKCTQWRHRIINNKWLEAQNPLWIKWNVNFQLIRVKSTERYPHSNVRQEYIGPVISITFCPKIREDLSLSTSCSLESGPSVICQWDLRRAWVKWSPTMTAASHSYAVNWSTWTCAS